MLNLSLQSLSSHLEKKTFSSVELTKFFLERIKLHNPSLNAFISIDEGRSLLMATKADELITNGEKSVLTGIPVAQKDIFCSQGWPSTCGSRMLENFIAPYDAMVIEKFNEVGAVNIGKTNMDEFAMGSSNETS